MLLFVTVCVALPRKCAKDYFFVMARKKDQILKLKLLLAFYHLLVSFDML